MAWPIVTLALFRKLPPGRAFLATMVAGYLILPEPPASFDFPLAPPLTKHNIPAFSAFLCMMFMYGKRGPLLPESLYGKSLVTIFVLSPVFTAFTNMEPVFYGQVGLPGLGIKDAIALSIQQFLLIIPFLLARQYLAFVERAKVLRIELAADYLVMAAWLAFLKSRLLLPPDPEEEGPSGEDLAAHLAFQLERLEAMRDAAARLMARDQLGRDFFPRGAPESVTRAARVEHQAGLMELLRAYSRIKTRADFQPLHLQRGPIYTMEQALERMRGLLGTSMDWLHLSAWLPEEWRRDPKKRRSATAASFAAALELVKAGRLDIRQDGTFQPILLRPKVKKEDEQ